MVLVQQIVVIILKQSHSAFGRSITECDNKYNRISFSGLLIESGGLCVGKDTGTAEGNILGISALL